MHREQYLMLTVKGKNIQSVSALQKTAENRRLDLKDLFPEGAVTDGILLLNQGQQECESELISL